MSDECNLEELTAFLEASDTEQEQEDKTSNTDGLEEAHNTASDRDQEKSTLTSKEDNDECNLEEIEAFLQASDDEDDTENTTKDINRETAEAKEDLELNKEVGDEDNANMDSAMEFEEFDEEDFKELEDIMDSQTIETSQGRLANKNESGGKNETQSCEDENNEKESVEASKESDNDNDTAEEESDTEQLPNEKIEAEMADMARRMKELQALLNKSKSSPCSSKKKKSQSGSGDKNVKGNLNSGSKQLKAGCSSVKEQSKACTSKTSCKSITECDGKSSAQSVRKSSNSSADSAKTPKQKSASGGKDCESSRRDRHYSDKNTNKTSPGRQEAKIKLTGTKKQKTHSPPRRKVENGDDSNPFFAKTDATRDTTQSRPASSLSKKTDEPVDSKTLFGDSDDSDWDDLAGDEKTKLSHEGQELKKMIKSGQKKREAHTPSYDPAVLKKPDMARWPDTNSKPIKLHPIQKVSQKPVLNPDTGTVSGKYKVKEEYKQRSTIAKEDVRESVTDPFCGIRIINPRIPMDVFQKKMDGRNLVKISRLACKTGASDLQRENWVTLGVVVHRTEPRQSAAGKAYCIWKLSDLHNCDKTVTFFLFGNVYKEHWKNDLGVVIGLLNPSIMDKAEKNQSEVALTINHPQQLLVMGISKDLGRCRSTTKAGQPCSSFINKMQGEFCTYHVQSAYRKSSSKRTELQASTGVTPKAFTQQKNKNFGSGCFFYGGNTYTTQRPQAKSSQDNITLKKLQSFDAKKDPGKITTMSLHELEAEDVKKIDKLREKDKDLLKLLSVPSAGSMNFVKHLVKKDANPTVNKTDGVEETLAPLASAKDLLKRHSSNLQQKKQQMKLLSSTPTLCKGFGFGGEISLDAPVKKGKGCASAELAKQVAIAKVKAKGGLNKEDPNAVRKKLTSPEAKEKIKKRVAEDMDQSPSSEDTGSEEPPKKKSKLLGGLDLNSPEVQQLLKKKSKHKGALAEAEAEQEDRYFSALEKKEQMEDKMGAIMEVPVKLFACLQCKYRYFSVHERCKKENHSIKAVKGTKRFFKCKRCKKRTVSIDRLPNKSCKDCGESNWERVSMLKERSGPKLESEELCLRGNEQKYLGGLQGKPSFNG